MKRNKTQKRKGERVPLAELTEETIASKTQSGDTPLHRAAKNGRFADIPRELLRLPLFMVANDLQQTPLHIAARHGHLNQVPEEFLTAEALTLADYHGRTPLHVAVNYHHADQIPVRLLTPEIISLPTKNFAANTLLHLAGETNTFSLFPSTCITPELLQIKNGYGLTPLESLQKHLPPQSQIVELQRLGVPFEEAGLTKERASGLIEDAIMALKAAKSESLAKRASDSSSSPGTRSPPSERKLEYVKANSTGFDSPESSSTKFTVLAKSGSRPGAFHRVTFMPDGPSLRVECSCQRHFQQIWICRHKLALIKGDEVMLFEPNQLAQLAQVRLLPQYKDLLNRTLEFERKLNELEKTTRLANSNFYAWRAAFCGLGQVQTVEEVFERVLLASESDALEVRAKMDELNRSVAELKSVESALKNDFALGLARGFHRNPQPESRENSTEGVE